MFWPRSTISEPRISERKPPSSPQVRRGCRPVFPLAALANPRRLSWKHILRRTYQRFNDDRLLATAAGVVFFGLLAVFPAVTALVSFYGLFADPSTIGANLQTLSLMLPEGSFRNRAGPDRPGARQGQCLAGLARFCSASRFALWSANAGVKAIIDALNVVYEEREKRSFVRLNLLSLAFTSGGIAALLLMVSAVVAFPLALDHLGLPPDSQVVVSLARWPLMLVVLLLALSVLYRFGPSRVAARWEWFGVGTLASPPCSGSPAPRRCPGTCRTSATTTRPTARSAPRSA